MSEIPHGCVIGEDGLSRCGWCVGDPAMRLYHDTEWGVPVRDDRALFARLMLECFQAGLSWQTILRKRDNFDRAFHSWDPVRIAAYDDADVARLLADPGIVRNRLKVSGAIRNARGYLAIEREHGSFASYVWHFVGDEPRVARPRARHLGELVPTTAASDALSKGLRGYGFTFVGSTICYAFMESAGLVDDHLADCFRAAG